jgi:hypothetical protein
MLPGTSQKMPTVLPAEKRRARAKKQYRRMYGPCGPWLRPFKYMKVLREVSRQRGCTLNVLAACTQMADAEGYFALDQKTVAQIARRCYLSFSQIEHNMRKLTSGDPDIEAPEFMRQEYGRRFGEHDSKSMHFLRDDYRGRLGLKIRTAIEEKRK